MSYDDYDDDVELSAECCETHKVSLLRRECSAFDCEDGYYDGYEDDPLWYDEGEMVRCSDCNGRGYFEWCPKCAEESNKLIAETQDIVV